MSAVKSNKAVKTDGVSPKVAWPTVALTALGILLCVLDGAGVVNVDDGTWIALLGSAAGTGLLGYSAPPALQKTNAATHRRRTHEGSGDTR
jgi:hypothetical protein